MTEPIDREVLRSAMLESLRRQEPQQYVNFWHQVARVLEERRLPVQPPSYDRDPGLRRIDDRRFREILWELINRGVLVQGLDSSNPEWPFLSLTEWGEEYVKQGGPDAYDPDGYLRALDADGQLDEIERRYLSEATAAFRTDLTNSSAVMLGAASEHLLVRLANEIVVADATATKVQKAITAPALGLLREVRRYIEPKRKTLPRDLAENFETTFLGVASLIRTSRNEGGHPALPNVARDDAFVALRLYPTYRRWVMRLIGALPI